MWKKSFYLFKMVLLVSFPSLAQIKKSTLSTTGGEAKINSHTIFYAGDNSADPFYEEKGGGVASENINIYRNILPATTYYVRAFVEDCNEVYYGNEVSFTTN